MMSGRARLVHPVALACCVLLWLPGLRGLGFLSDDFTHLETWGLPPVAEILKWFSQEYTGFYRPLTALLWNAEYALWGMNPFGYHLVNLAMHAACAFLVWRIGRRLFADPAVGLWAAIVFLFQPAHTFAVLMVAGLTGLLGAMLVLAAFALHLWVRQQRRPVALLAPLVVFATGLAAKELALCLPLLIAAWELGPGGRKSGPWHAVLFVIPYLAVTAGYLLFRFIAFGQLSHSPLAHSNTAPVHLLTNLFAYIASALAPWGVESLKALVRAYPVPFIAGGAIGCMAVVGVAWHWRRAIGAPHVFALLWLLLGLAPVVRLYSPWNAYLASAGAAWLVAGLLTRRGPLLLGRVRAGTAAVAIYCLLGFAYTISMQTQWRTASDMAAVFLDRLQARHCGDDRPVKLVNLPVELGHVPVFGGLWGVNSGLRLRGCSATVVALTSVRQASPHTRFHSRRIGDREIRLDLLDGSFFRLGGLDVLSHRTKPGPGYSLSVAGTSVTVLRSEGGTPVSVQLSFPPDSRTEEYLAWNGQGLVSLDSSATNPQLE